MATKKQKEASVQAVGAHDPAISTSAPALTEASGVNLGHESAGVDSREGTTAAQNQIDWNDPKGIMPDGKGFAGNGIDISVYGKAAKS